MYQVGWKTIDLLLYTYIVGYTVVIGDLDKNYSSFCRVEIQSVSFTSDENIK